jgi:hypothetical protein
VQITNPFSPTSGLLRSNPQAEDVFQAAAADLFEGAVGVPDDEGVLAVANLVAVLAERRAGVEAGEVDLVSARALGEDVPGVGVLNSGDEFPAVQAGDLGGDGEVGPVGNDLAALLLDPSDRRPGGGLLDLDRRNAQALGSLIQLL